MHLRVKIVFGRHVTKGGIKNKKEISNADLNIME